MSYIIRRWASTAKFQAERPEEIMHLVKPIGLTSKPMPIIEKHHKTMQERKKELLDPKLNRIRREELKKEFARSSFEEFYRFRHTGGKIFTAPLRMFPAKDSKYMINIKGTRLDDPTNAETTLSHLLVPNSPTLVRLFGSALGQQQIKEFTEDVDLHKLGVRVVDVNTPTNWVNRLLVKWFARRIRRQEIGDNGDVHKYLLASGKLSPQDSGAIWAPNELAGYLYVVDKNGKIRWATSGPVIDNEKEHMLDAVRQLKEE